MDLYNRRVNYNECCSFFLKWITLISVLIIILSASDIFNDGILRLTLHKSYDSKFKVNYVLRKCLYAALLSTQKFQLFVDLILSNSSDECMKDVTALFVAYKRHFLTSWQYLLLKSDQKNCPLKWDIQDEKKGDMVMVIRCMVGKDIQDNLFNNIGKKRYSCIRLQLNTDNNGYNSFQEAIFSELEKEKFQPRIRHIRQIAALTSKTSLNLSTKRTTTQNNVHVSKTTEDIAKSTSSDIEYDERVQNVTALHFPTPDNDLVFGYFKWYVLLLLGLFSVLLVVTTAVACYYDCENRRRTLLGGKHAARPAPIPPVLVRPPKKRIQSLDGKKKGKYEDDITQDSTVQSRTLLKRRLLIEAQFSASTKSKSVSEYASEFPEPAPSQKMDSQMAASSMKEQSLLKSGQEMSQTGSEEVESETSAPTRSESKKSSGVDESDSNESEDEE